MPDPLHYSVAGEVFIRFPDYMRGVVPAYDVKNGNFPAELVGMLRDAEASARERLNLENLAGHPRVAAWREAFRKSGIKPSEFRLILKRVESGRKSS